jgi:hypothetical protein
VYGGSFFSGQFGGGTVSSATTFLGDVTIGSTTAGKNLTVYGTINQAKGSNIVSATTTDIGAATGNFVDVTGTTTITGFGTVQAGTLRYVRFTGVLTLTYNATSLILPGSANILTAAGDRATFVSLGSGNWLCLEYLKASGLAIGAIDEQVIASTANISLSQARSAQINNYGQSGNVIATLPAVAKGYSVDFVFGTTAAFYYRITAGAGDAIWLDGVAGSDGGYVGVSSAAAGNAISCRSFQTGASSYDWYCVTISGSWVAG